MRRSSVPRSSTRWRSACRSGRSTGCGWRSWRGSATRAPLAELERRALLVADGTDDGVGAVRVGDRAADDEAGVWEDPGEGRPGAGRVAGYARSRADEGGPRGSAVERQRARTEHLARVGGGRAVDRAAAGPACARLYVRRSTWPANSCSSLWLTSRRLPSARRHARTASWRVARASQREAMQPCGVMVTVIVVWDGYG